MPVPNASARLRVSLRLLASSLYAIFLNMISNSWEWKKLLYKNYQTIAKYINNIDSNSTNYSKFEIALFTSAFIIRKLSESNKFPPAILNKEINILEIKKKNDIHIDFINDHRFTKLYEEKLNKKIINLGYLINQLIHSFSFYLILNRKGQLNYIFINSDFSKKKSAYLIKLSVLLELILFISEGSMNQATYKRVNKYDRKGTIIESNVMNLSSGTYELPNKLDLKKIIQDTFAGKIYKRKKDE
ncbi:hypothetical protein LFX15_18910 [Leptospira levettii]|uniref:hypothetical protein n=1 Tax=Leptospira levettii TaxID=2023178 RepID=UPI001EEAE906|nr:hypothetical protein [Leptospira levettii]MCG6150373.1 hypothetical protein [Leptospira levettii]